MRLDPGARRPYNKQAMKRAGLTLVELLVVLSAIALLAALLFPAFHVSREQAKATACEANLRELAFGLHAYEQDNQSFPYGYGGPGKAPPPGGIPGNAALDVQGCWWFNFIGAIHYRTLRDMKAMQCPSKHLDSDKLKSDILCGNYGVNRACARMPPILCPAMNLRGLPYP